MALPAVADVRRRFGGSRLIVAARRSVAGLFAMVPGVDEVIELEWSGRPLRLGGMGRDAARLRATGAGVAVLLPNSFAAAWLARRARIPERWGYAGDLRTPLLTQAIDKPAGSRHQGPTPPALRSLGGAERSARGPRGGSEAGREQARRLRRCGMDGVRPLVALAPGAAVRPSWLPAHFARLAADLVASYTSASWWAAAARRRREVERTLRTHGRT
jgi:ADP-heptose:LPS heptosyltransferase